MIFVLYRLVVCSIIFALTFSPEIFQLVNECAYSFVPTIVDWNFWLFMCRGFIGRDKGFNFFFWLMIKRGQNALSEESHAAAGFAANAIFRQTRQHPFEGFANSTFTARWAAGAYSKPEF